jgi:NAD(P)-dependent dehydrogenase (short-subunit alcohol dehydrogenase family)
VTAIDATRGSTPTSDIEGRVIIVTGAGRGIGRGLAQHFASRGAVVVAAELVASRLDQVVETIATLGRPCHGVLCDVTDRDGFRAMADGVMASYGRIDALVNNAIAFGGPSPLIDLDEAALGPVLATGIRGTLWGMQAVYPHMKAAGWGRIVNVGSAAGVIGFPGFGAYNAAKEAVRALTRTAAREWAADGIVVNCYCPASFGSSRPERSNNSFVDASHDAFWHQHPMGRMGDAEHDIAPAVAFLCSDACRYMTGQTLMVDGGTYTWA